MIKKFANRNSEQRRKRRPISVVIASALAAVFLLATLGGGAASAEGNDEPAAARSADAQDKDDPAPDTTVILVHGAFADGSAWTKVIPKLERRGLNVVAVQIPLTSVADDVAVTRRAIEAAPGPVVLVGHSWGGMAVTELGTHEKVKSIVYLSAFAGDEGQSVHDLQDIAHIDNGIPTVPGFDNPVISPDGFVSLSREDMIQFFAPDISEKKAGLLFVTQGHLFGPALDDELTQAGWKTKPTWYIVTTEDQLLSPDHQRFMADTIGATAVEIDASHASMLSKPGAVARVIRSAAAD